MFNRRAERVCCIHNSGHIQLEAVVGADVSRQPVVEHVKIGGRCPRQEMLVREAVPQGPACVVCAQKLEPEKQVRLVREEAWKEVDGAVDVTSRQDGRTYESLLG